MSSGSELELEEDLAPRRVDWRLWRRVLGHLKPYPGPVAGMIGGGGTVAVVRLEERLLLDIWPSAQAEINKGRKQQQQPEAKGDSGSERCRLKRLERRTAVGIVLPRRCRSCALR